MEDESRFSRLQLTLATIMPPNGLYPILRHHLYDQSTPKKRPTFNSMDFIDEEPTRSETNEDRRKIAEERMKRKQEKREWKEKRRQKKALLEAQMEKESGTVEKTPQAYSTDTTPAASAKNGRYGPRGPRGPYKKREKAPDGTPVPTMKRKREGDAHIGASGVASNNVNSLLDPNFLSGLKRTMGDLGAVFGQPVETTESSTESPPRKRGRPLGWRQNATGDFTKNKTPDAHITVTPIIASSTIKSKARATETDMASGSRLDKSPKMIRTPVPLPQKSSRRMSEPQVGQTTSIRPEAEVLVTETPPSRMRQTPATTPRQLSIPFLLSKTSSLSGKQPLKMKKGPTIDISPLEGPMSASKKLTRVDKHVIGSQGSVNPLTSSQADAFTSSNLMSYKQKFNDTPKPRPRRRRAVSEAMSFTSSSSSTTPSIRDMLTHTPKPYTRPATASDPFTSSPKKKKKTEKAIDTHDEADTTTFTATYKASRDTVNFTDETEYLAEYDAHVAAGSAAGPLPCLHKATGCSSKSEQVLRMQREDPSNVLKMTVTNESDAVLSAALITRAQQGTTFLRHAITARIPVPIGWVDGVWKLFCPEYTAAHVDKYGFGQRTLSIHSVVGNGGSLFKAPYFPSPCSSSSLSKQMQTTYTARLHIPPRSMAFTLAEFVAPPHASFRATTLKTVAEGYKMEVIFLGNGYLKLRVDVHLLLMGKSAAEAFTRVGGGGGGGLGGNKAAGGKAAKPAFGIWEFLGVHEKAVVWTPQVDELEVEGRRLCAKYDGA
jgi:hypothetical protein